MYDVKTDHQVVPLGANLMHLLDSRTGDLIAFAQRHDGTARWVVGATGTPDTRIVDDRGAAITALTEAALETLGGTGYSTLVPSGLSEVP